MKYNPRQVYHKYYLNDWDEESKVKFNPCDKCEVGDICDEIADTINNIEYCICLSKPSYKKYKESHPRSYFKVLNKFT